MGNETLVKPKMVENGALSKSAVLLDNLIRKLQFKNEDKLGLEDVSKLVNYKTDFEIVKKDYPKQAVVVLRLLQPEVDTSVLNGILSEDTEVVVTHISEGRFGSGTWGLPMGKAESQKDMCFGDQSLGSVLINTARREFGEEVELTSDKNRQVESRGIIVGSFIDKNTSFLMHVILDEIYGQGHEKLSLTLPDLRENDEASFRKINEAIELSPMTPGVKLSYLMGLNFIKEQNFLLGKSGRYVDNK